MLVCNQSQSKKYDMMMSPYRRKYSPRGGREKVLLCVVVLVLVDTLSLTNGEDSEDFDHDFEENFSSSDYHKPHSRSYDDDDSHFHDEAQDRMDRSIGSSSSMQNFLSSDHYKPYSPSYGDSYFDDEDEAQDRIDRSTGSSSSMQDLFLNMFDWKMEMPSMTILNTFMDNERDLPFLREISRDCGRNEFYYGLNHRHMRAVTKLREVIMEQTSTEDAVNMAAGVRDRGEVNPHVWVRAVYGSTMHRRDMQRLRKPSIVEVMPSMFIPKEVIGNLKRSASSSGDGHRCIPIDGSVGRDNGIENLLWYWREDVMLNAHHWYWHLAYPIDGSLGFADREGELFYFMHHTMLARYHSERLSVRLPPTGAFDVQPGARIPLAYNPHLNEGNSGNDWSARPAGVPISDTMSNALPNDPFFVSARNRSIQLSRVFEGISQGVLIDASNQPVDIRTYEGITILGNVVEANVFSINPELYGYHGIHNNGHNLISLALDPREELGIPPGPMGDPATAMRDVMFYPYHVFIDSIFDRYKNTLQPYQLTEGDWPLLVHGVAIHSFKVQSKNLPSNVLHTFWNSHQYDLSRGLDFNRSFARGPLWACHQHLDHQDFDYELKIDRKDYSHAKTVTVRLFMAPRYDLKGRRYNLEEERHFMFILDTFKVPLKPGMNTIRRRSVETPLTVDFPRSTRQLAQEDADQMPYCGCGWPHHLLIPKGNREGLSFDFFAMLTDSSQDYVQQGRSGGQNCRPAYIFCGVMGELYPDARPMGYPWDRRSFVSEYGHGEAVLEDLVREVPNMAFAHVKIIHFDELGGGGGTGSYGDAFSIENSNDGSGQFFDDGSNALSSDGPFTGNSFPQPAPGPPPTVLNLRVRHPGEDAESYSGSVSCNAPNLCSSSSGSNSNGLGNHLPTDPFRFQEEINKGFDSINPFRSNSNSRHF